MRSTELCRTGLLLNLFSLLLLSVGCGDSSPTGQSRDKAAAIPDEATAKALAARDALFEQLSGRLQEVMTTRGAAEAISVCSQEARGIAEKVSQEHGVAIGRTSLKLRNEDNRPPEWAAPLLSAEATAPQFVSLDSDQVGAILPIKLKPQCLMCHGPQETIPPDVQTRLADLYPNDSATGFKDGDLRGWFWVEVPSRTSRD